MGIFKPSIIFSCVIFFASVSSFAQFKNVQLLQSDMSPFSDGITPETGLDTLEKISSALDVTVKEEMALIEKRAQIEALGFGATEFLLHIKEQALSLEAEGDLSSIQPFLQAGRGPVAEFFSSLDIYIQDDMDVAMALAYQSARLQIIEMREDGVAVDKLKPIFAKLERYKDQYIANKDQYRKPKDTFRTTPYKKFFVAFKGFVEETNGMPNISWPQALKNKVQATVKVFRLGLTLIPSAIELVKTVMLIKDPAGQNVPMTAAIFQGARKLSKLNRVSIRISGANNLPTKTDLQTVNIFVASHRHGLNDVMSVAGLNNDSIVLFGAARNFLPSVLNKIFGMKDKIINRMNENLGFIVVGKGAKPEPVEKALKILKESSVRNFLIFPGGRLPEGLGATMGVREKFFAEYGLIHSIENAGYKVNLIPLAFPDNARLFDDTSFLFENAPEELLVEVYPMIDDHTRRVIVKAAGPESLGLLLRFGLTESLHTNDTLVWGQVRADRLVNTIDRFVTQNTSDKSFCARRLKSLKATADF